MNALKATDTTIEVDDSAKTLVRKIQGVRVTAKKTEEEKKALATTGKELVEISSSQISYNSRLDNFDKLIKLLTNVALYAPNEADLKAKNTVVVTATTPLSNARISRNDVLYKDITV